MRPWIESSSPGLCFERSTSKKGTSKTFYVEIFEKNSSKPSVKNIWWIFHVSLVFIFWKQTSPTILLLPHQRRLEGRGRGKETRRYQKSVEEEDPQKKGKSCSWNWKFKSLYLVFIPFERKKKTREKLKRKMFVTSSREEKRAKSWRFRVENSHVRLANTLTSREIFRFETKNFFSHSSPMVWKCFPTLIHLWGCWKHSLKITHECLIIREFHPSPELFPFLVSDLMQGDNEGKLRQHKSR